MSFDGITLGPPLGIMGETWDVPIRGATRMRLARPDRRATMGTELPPMQGAQRL